MFKKILAFCEVILVVILIAVMLVVFGLFFIFSDKSAVPSVFGHYFFLLQSDNMAPALSNGDLVISEDNSLSTLDKGAVIYCTLDDSTKAVMRIYSVETVDGQTYFNIASDNRSVDTTIKIQKDSVISRCTFHSAALGKLISLSRTATGFCLLVILPCLVLIIIQAVHIIMRKRAENEAIIALDSMESTTVSQSVEEKPLYLHDKLPVLEEHPLKQSISENFTHKEPEKRQPHQTEKKPAASQKSKNGNPGADSREAQKRGANASRNQATNNQQAKKPATAPISSTKPEQPKKLEVAPIASTKPEQPKKPEAAPIASTKPEQPKKPEVAPVASAKPEQTKKPEAAPVASAKPEQPKKPEAAPVASAKPEQTKKPEAAPVASTKPEQPKKPEAAPVASTKPEQSDKQAHDVDIMIQPVAKNTTNQTDAPAKPKASSATKTDSSSFFDLPEFEPPVVKTVPIPEVKPIPAAKPILPKSPSAKSNGADLLSFIDSQKKKRDN